MSYAIDMADGQVIDSIKDQIKDALDKRFPDGSPEDFMFPMAEAMLEAFFNGARWAEEAIRNDDMAVKREASLLAL